MVGTLAPCPPYAFPFRENSCAALFLVRMSFGIAACGMLREPQFIIAPYAFKPVLKHLVEGVGWRIGAN